MVNRLLIKNFTIIDELDIPIQPGLTVITGETGSGKSIILEALATTTGGKTDKIMVRSGTERAVVDSRINNNSFRRIIGKNGRSKAYLDDAPITLAELRKRIGSTIDFHGQHDQQFILNAESHIEYLDRFCGHKDKVRQLENIFYQLQESRQSLKDLHRTTSERKEKLELLSFQAQEIDAANPQPDEDHDLGSEYRRLNHLENILSFLNTLKGRLDNRENGLMNELIQLNKELSRLIEYDVGLQDLYDLLNSTTIQLQEADSEIREMLVKSEFDSEQLSSVEERLQALEYLKRKYGGSLDAVIQTRKDIEKTLKSLLLTAKTDTDQEHLIYALEEEYKVLAKSLHKNRVKRADQLASLIEKSMQGLNMPGAIFQIRIITIPSDDSFISLDGAFVQALPSGVDKVEFFLSANPGEQLKPLVAIASGGEVSRIMLAIKTVFQEFDPVPTLVFDEIDSGISGKTAEKVAKQLLKLSQLKQVICITHLPQIVRKADHHLHISKTIHDGRTTVNAKYLHGQMSKNAIRELFIGDTVLG